ncbi:hypothetical protein BT67DRAFT_437904 [Trichocladium antarcticum]|uniref:Uncharacterized protein n=1 Tax=Trichocladium antarcticum TaxID=1450529 RepID=A0AAN6ZHZ0_9PEZI|nr:hypothetical protein BT67DRAFT_437904 [Trichocladium antarcticum]
MAKQFEILIIYGRDATAADRPCNVPTQTRAGQDRTGPEPSRDKSKTRNRMRRGDGDETGYRIHRLTSRVVKRKQEENSSRRTKEERGGPILAPDLYSDPPTPVPAPPNPETWSIRSLH